MNTRNWWRKTVLFVLGLAGLATLVQCAGPVASVGGVPVEPTMLAVTPAPTKTAVPTGTASPTPYPTPAPFHLTAAVDVSPPQGVFYLDGLYADTAVGLCGGNVATLDLTRGHLELLTSVTGCESVAGPKISAHWITWYERYCTVEGKYRSRLMVYDRLQNRTFQLEDAVPTWPGPVLSGDVVVWVEFLPKTSSGLQGDIIARDLVTGERWAVATGPNHQDYPHISGQWVIYLEFTEESRKERGESKRERYAYLRAYHLSTGETLPLGQVPHPNDSSAGTYHTLAGHKVVWCGTSAATGLRGLYVYDLESRNEWPLPLNYVCSGLEPFGDDALVVRGTLVYSLEDGSLLGTIDTSAMEGDVGKVFVSGNRVLVQTIKEEFGGSTFPLYTMQLTH